MNNNQKVIIMGGGTFSYVRNHLALCAPAFGATAHELTQIAFNETSWLNPHQSSLGSIECIFTKMADPFSDLETNDDVAKRVDKLLLDQAVKIIIFNVALCDFHGEIDGAVSGKHAQRLKTSDGRQALELIPAEKIIKRIRKTRKDIFLVAFKTTTGATEDEQYLAGLNLLKENSCNLVLANDTVTRMNMIITPEEARYCVTQDRKQVLTELWRMTAARSALTFTRSTVVESPLIKWDSNQIPESLYKVVNHCIERGAYKPFRGSTAGHFAFKTDDGFITSIRKKDYNNLKDVGMVFVESKNDDEVIAYGAKPSVGGQSQRIVFREHPGYDCIVHFHCPPKHEKVINVRSQQYLECGSHECGQNTSAGLVETVPGIKAVYLDNHGPNIVFNHSIDPQKVIDFIDEHFDLTAKTGGLVA